MNSFEQTMYSACMDELEKIAATYPEKKADSLGGSTQSNKLTKALTGATIGKGPAGKPVSL